MILTPNIQYIAAGILFIIIFLTGKWLSKITRPYNPLILTVHKLISLASGVFLFIVALGIFRMSQIGGLDTITLFILAFSILIALILMITGGLLTTNIELPEIITNIHKYFPILAVILTGLMFYIASLL
ncbi:MAG: hypothetical protein JEZ06_03470 [Anaerolineaceae bacterium]|nr:hypothetical protein [Anaerolineaceae bacterium]